MHVCIEARNSSPAQASSCGPQSPQSNSPAAAARASRGKLFTRCMVSFFFLQTKFTHARSAEPSWAEATLKAPCNHHSPHDERSARLSLQTQVSDLRNELRQQHNPQLSPNQTTSAFCGVSWFGSSGGKPRVRNMQDRVRCAGWRSSLSGSSDLTLFLSLDRVGEASAVVGLNASCLRFIFAVYSDFTTAWALCAG